MGDPVARRRLALVAAGGGLLLLLLVAGAWLMLAGDARQEPAARPATQAGAAPAAVLASLDDEPVLRALFGEWDPKTRTAVVQASRLAPAGPGQQASADDRMQVGIHARLPFTEGGRDKTAVLLQSVELDDGGAPIECHACGALLGVHVYARAGDGRGWVRERGSSNVVHVGAYGALPAASLVELAPGRTGLLMTYGDVGGGYARSLGLLVDIGGDTPREASGYIDLGASNEGACDASVKPGTPSAREPAEACWSYQGAMVLAPPAAPRAPQGTGAIAWHDLTVRWRGTRAAPENGADAFEQSVTVQHDGRTWPGRVAPKLLLP